MDNSVSVGKVAFHKPCLAQPFTVSCNSSSETKRQQVLNKGSVFYPHFVELKWGRVCPGMRRLKPVRSQHCPSPHLPLFEVIFYSWWIQEQYQLATISSRSYSSKSRKKTPMNFMNKRSPNLLDWFHTSDFFFPLIQESEQELKAPGRDNRAQISSHQYQRKSWHCPVNLWSADP